MSINDKKAIRVIIILGRLLQAGHFGIYKPDVLRFVNKLAELYYPQNASERELDRLALEILTAEAEIKERFTKTTIGSLMSAVLVMCDDFARFCQGERGRIWNGFIYLAENNDLIKSLSHNQEIALEVMEQGEEMADVVAKA